jgi:putative ATP-dependent endonuclease of OLD family
MLPNALQPNIHTLGLQGIEYCSRLYTVVLEHAMTIRRVAIENYRSIETLDLEFSPVNALVGPNNSGKSNILRALNIVLGETWPTRPFTDKDYFQHDLTRTIHIQVFFHSPLQCDHHVEGFWLQCAANQPPDFLAIDANGNECHWPNGSVKRVNSVMRDEVALLYLGLDREAETQLRSNQWTLYGKLLRRIEAGIAPATKNTFTTAVSTAYQTHLQPSLIAAQTIMDNIVRSQTGLNIQLQLQVLNPLQVLKNVRPCILDGTMNIDPEECGAGVQSAIALAVAKAYADIFKNPVVLALEEPELYLHPHGCRHFYRLLQQFSGAGLQIIYTTHERSFVNVGDFDSVHIVRKSAQQTEVTSGRRLHIQGADQLRMQSRFNDRVNEVFFSAAVVLLEGDPDEIACRASLEALGMDLDKRSISLIAVGGQAEIPVFAELLAGLRIPSIALVDEDPGNASSAANRARIGQHLPPAHIMLQSPTLETLWGLATKPKRVVAMRTFPAACAVAQNIPQVYRDLRILLGNLAP